MTEPFDLFIGVDQTGAARDSGRRAGPLPLAAFVATGERRWRAVTARSGKALRLPRLSLSSLRETLGSIGIDLAGHRCALMVDCVFGLAEALAAAPPTALLDAAAGFRAKGLGEAARFGRPVSEAFFRTLWSGAADLPLPARRCERLARANSVFLTRPFQKNVQTGTFRIWRDLGESRATDGDWFRIWPFDAVGDGAVTAHAWIFESFPSLLWRELLGLRTRDRTQLARAARRTLRTLGTVEVDTWRIVAEDADAADAFVLALSGALLQQTDRLWEPWPGFFRERWLESEGWIAGLTTPSGLTDPAKLPSVELDKEGE